MTNGSWNHIKQKTNVCTKLMAAQCAVELEKPLFRSSSPLMNRKRMKKIQIYTSTYNSFGARKMFKLMSTLTEQNKILCYACNS